MPVAITKEGIVTPNVAINMTKPSCHLFCLSAEITPSGIPTKITTSTEASPIFKVAGKPSTIKSFTVTPAR